MIYAVSHVVSKYKVDGFRSGCGLAGNSKSKHGSSLIISSSLLVGGVNSYEY